jgi:hypothetical protein
MTNAASAPPSSCRTCQGSGEFPTDSGLVDCPDCGGSGTLPAKNVLVEWRMRDVERQASRVGSIEAKDALWLLTELRAARTALTEIIALAHDVSDEQGIPLRIRFAANRALGLYTVTKT